jgi:hypothetical protein
MVLTRLRNKKGRQWKLKEEVTLECIVYGRNRDTLKAFEWLGLVRCIN